MVFVVEDALVHRRILVVERVAFVTLVATLCTDYRQIYWEEVVPNILLTTKVENFRGHFGNSGPQNRKKLRIS